MTGLVQRHPVFLLQHHNPILGPPATDLTGHRQTHDPGPHHDNQPVGKLSLLLRVNYRFGGLRLYRASKGIVTSTGSSSNSTR